MSSPDSPEERLRAEEDLAWSQHRGDAPKEKGLVEPEGQEKPPRKNRKSRGKRDHDPELKKARRKKARQNQRAKDREALEKEERGELLSTEEMKRAQRAKKRIMKPRTKD